MRRYLYLWLLSLTLCSCCTNLKCYTEEREALYLKSTETPALKLPPGLTLHTQQDYTIPAATGPKPTYRLEPLPPKAKF